MNKGFLGGKVCEVEELDLTDLISVFAQKLGGSEGRGASKKDLRDEALEWSKERSLSSSVDRLVCSGRHREVKK